MLVNKCTAHLVILAVHFVLLDHLPAGQAAVVDNGVEVSPGSELAFPIGDSGEGGNDEEGPVYAGPVHLRQ